MIYYYFILLLTWLLLNFYIINGHLNPDSSQEIILCRKCGGDVADSNYLFAKSSPGATKSEKRNLFGNQNVTVLTLVNPFHVAFEVITLEKARCEHVGPAQRADSWFPGFQWRICVCPHCGQHLGWTFEYIEDKSVENMTDYVHSFHGLIISNILGENFTDSLIMMPKTFNM